MSQTYVTDLCHRLMSHKAKSHKAKSPKAQSANLRFVIGGSHDRESAAQFTAMSSPVSRGITWVKDSGRKAIGMFDTLERREKLLVGVGLGCLVTMMSLLGIFHNKVLAWMSEFSTRFRDVPFNWLILFMLYVAVSFPPMIGYSALSAFTGMVYGFPGGWPLLAAGTLIGSFLSFMTFRYLLRERAQRLAEKSVKFMAFVETLKQDSFMLLWMIRLCPLPYSLSNAGMSTVPSVEPWKFFVATLCCTPKLFLHIFIGSRLAKLSSSKDASTFWANLISVVIAVTVGVVTSWLIYKRTSDMAAALQARGHTYNDPNSAFPTQAEADDFEISDGSDSEPSLSENPFRAAAENRL